MPGQRGRPPKWAPDAKKEAISLSTILESSTEAGGLTNIPARTIRAWIAEFRLMDDSELEAFIAIQKRLADGLWAVEQVAALEFAQDLRADGQARGYQSAIVAAGICSTKLEGKGQPKTVGDVAPTPPSLLREIPGLPTDKQPQEG